MGIIRDHNRVVLLTFTKFFGHQFFFFFFAELIALLMGLKLACQMGFSTLACQMGFSTLFVESNSATIVSWVSSLGLGGWDFGYLLSKIRHLCINYHVHIHHVYRETNHAPDFMVNWACKYHTSQSFNGYHSLPTRFRGILELNS